VLVHDLDFGQHRHEVRVAVPPRHDVKVNVVWNPGAGGAAGVGADVEALRLELLTENHNRAPRGAHEVCRLGIVEVIELSAVSCRRDHDVPGVVWEFVQHDQRPRRSPHDELCVRIVGVLEHAAEQAADLRLAGDVLHAPGRPQSLH